MAVIACSFFYLSLHLQISCALPCQSLRQALYLKGTTVWPTILLRTVLSEFANTLHAFKLFAVHTTFFDHHSGFLLIFCTLQPSQFRNKMNNISFLARTLALLSLFLSFSFSFSISCVSFSISFSHPF